MPDNTEAELAAEATPSQLDVVRNYLEARANIESITETAKAAKADYEAAERAVLELYEREGCQSVRVSGKLVSLTRKLWASPRADQQAALIASLREHGYDDLISERTLSQTLSAWVRERDAEDDPIPDDVMQHLNVAEKFGLSVTTRATAARKAK